MSKRRDDLAAFLRTRRERVTPEMVGLPPGTRRRTPGLRREEVAQLAGVGVTWYTWLEQGRPINVSLQVLDSIARTLMLDAAERHQLHLLAGHAEAAPTPDGGLVTPSMQVIIDQLSPLPAAYSNSRHDVLAWNPAYAALFPELVSAPVEERNSLWQCFVHREWRTALVNREQELHGSVAVFRGAYTRHADDPCWRDFVKRLSAASPEFAALWATHDVADPRSRAKTFNNEVVGELRFTSAMFNCASAPETRMTVYTPVDEATRSAVVWLTAHSERAHGMLGA
ncbi:MULTISPECIES: helix-turn-helix transcriptional regulator [Nonomuraea]|uniref:Transcriptional regulator with XRE-family HTH domain n=2 Tax=Nonomuraea TaxID=83681 RepID=A0A7W5VD13_9ACTN|nr:helix-turn-helix transcriptional regulator [Nonomuraea dietziae]MBB3729220.1 transcriptional regulator with XRE-family HTH domain [Nonomuraea dietziae]